MLGRKEKSNSTSKTNNTIRGNKPEGTGERSKTKMISRRDLKTKQKKNKKNRTFQNSEKKFYHQVGGECTNTYQQPDDKETKQFWRTIWEWREHNRKTE